MSHTIDTKPFLDTVRDLLKEGKGAIPVPVAGSSMCPFLHPGDIVYLDAPHAPLRRGDIVLFTRKSGNYVLHRIATVNSDGSFEMLGDAQIHREHVPSQAQIHAVVRCARHNGKLITPESQRWRFYATIWLQAAPLRPYIGYVYRLLRRKKTAEDS